MVRVPGGSGDGLSWTEAIGLGEAFAAAEARNTNSDEEDDVAQIWVARDTYTVSEPLVFPSGNVQVYGGFGLLP